MRSPIIVSLDLDSIERALAIINQTKELVWGYKVGPHLLYQNLFNKDLMKIRESAENLFVDLKFHDIPNTVSNAIAGIKSLEPKMFTIHAAGSGRMIQRAVDTCEELWGVRHPVVIAVTVLTSIDEDSWKLMFPSITIAEAFDSLIKEAAGSGAGGIVCSGHEVANIKKTYPNLIKIVPGIRLEETVDDQARTMTPRQAFDSGADYLVIGRPIVEANNPKEIVEKILNDIH